MTAAGGDARRRTASTRRARRPASHALRGPCAASVDVRCSFAATTASVAQARHWIEGRLRDLRAPAATVLAIVLATSELVTNAVLHGTGTHTVTLRLRYDAGGIRVEVSADASTTAPRLQPRRAGLPGGHGMHIIDALARAWGWRPGDGGSGKVVWAAFDCAPPGVLPAHPAPTTIGAGHETRSRHDR